MRGNEARSSSVLRALVVALGVTVPLACTGATGEVRGGDARFDAASPEPLVASTEPTFADAADTSWRGIYRDFFGRRSKASCARTGACHSTPGQGGSRGSNFVCANLDDCYQSLRTGKKAPSANDPRPLALVEDVDKTAPENAYLFSVLRLQTAEGIVENKGMPDQPKTFAYTVKDVDRMKAWIKAGANND